MGKFFDDTMQGLLEAVTINDGKMKLAEKKNMASLTFIVSKIAKNFTCEHSNNYQKVIQK